MEISEKGSATLQTKVQKIAYKSSWYRRQERFLQLFNGLKQNVHTVLFPNFRFIVLEVMVIIHATVTPETLLPFHFGKFS